MSKAVKSPEPSGISAHIPGEFDMRVIARPENQNIYGIMSGGWVFEQLDIAGAYAAQRIFGRRFVTAGVSDLSFKGNIKPGEALNVHSSITRTGRTSVTVHIAGRAVGRNPADKDKLVASGLFTFVAVDGEGDCVTIRPATE